MLSWKLDGDLIVLRNDLKFGKTLYVPGDSFDAMAQIKSGAVDEATMKMIKSQGYFDDLTAETYGIATARRPAGSPPMTGWTQSYLVAKGVIDPSAKVPEPKVAKVKPGARTIDTVELTDEARRIGLYCIQPRVAGKFRFFDVTDEHGKLLRAKSFSTEKRAEEFVATLSTPPGPADTQKTQDAEPAHGRQLQPEPVE